MYMYVNICKYIHTYVHTYIQAPGCSLAYGWKHLQQHLRNDRSKADRVHAGPPQESNLHVCVCILYIYVCIYIYICMISLCIICVCRYVYNFIVHDMRMYICI